MNKKIAIVGSRGIPNRYGGFEKFTEVISTELVKKGYTVYVSCEYTADAKNKEYKGVFLFYFPFKPFEYPLLRIIYEFLYDGYSLLWASRKTDYVYMLGYSAAIFFFIPKLFGKKLFVNPDGMEWKRSKFNSLIRFLLKISEKLAVFWADEIIADSKEIKRYFDDKYDIDSKYISYGVFEIEEVKWDPTKLPKSLKHISHNPNYYLVVARLEPENNIEIIIKGYLKSKTKKPLIIVGNFADPAYENKINNIINANPNKKNIIFTGGIYNTDLLNMLRQNCYAYIHGHSVGGTNPSLLEAMISKNLIIAHDNEFNREVCDECAFYFKDLNGLNNYLDWLDLDNFKHVHHNDIFERVIEKYSWNKIINQYADLINSVK